jgi:hypothetical protein
MYFGQKKGENKAPLIVFLFYLLLLFDRFWPKSWLPDESDRFRASPTIFVAGLTFSHNQSGCYSHKDYFDRTPSTEVERAFAAHFSLTPNLLIHERAYIPFA